ncbi:MAG TPA: trypsin-like peptidase domain-containing protein [Pirellulales bacterium]|nr:trypsin-like peptidase domain-containing protein [Pirellulales bacterium]
MDHEIACPRCRQTLMVGQELLGQDAQCPACQATFVAPPSRSQTRALEPAPMAPAREGGNRRLVIAAGLLLVGITLPLAGFAAFEWLRPSKRPVVAQGEVVTRDRSAVPAPPSAESTGGLRPPLAMPPSVESTGGLRPPLATPPSAESTGGLRPPLATNAEIVRWVEPSVVIIEVPNVGLGSGFILDEQGTIATNYHVIEGAKAAKVKFADETTADVQGFLVVAPGKDLALLRINPSGKKLKPLSLQTSVPGLSGPFGRRQARQAGGQSERQ